MRNIGVVVVNYNDYKNTSKFIKNIVDYSSIKRIVVVDNNSTDNSLKKLKELENEKIHIISSSVNRGFAEGLNIGSKYILEKLKDPVILCSNTDIVIPDEDTIKSMVKNIKNDTVCVMPKVKEGNTFKYGWKLTNKYIDLLVNIPFINRFYRNNYIDYKEEYFKSDTSIVDVIYGCFFMIDGNILKSVDFFDSNTFLYYEEYILAKKLKNINKLSIVDNKVYVTHMHNQTIGNNISNLNKYKIYKRSQRYFEKYYNKAGFITMFIFHLFYIINVIPYKIKALFKK